MKRLLTIISIVFVASCTFNPGANPGGVGDRTDGGSDVTIRDVVHDGTSTADVTRDVRPVEDTTSMPDMTRTDTPVEVDVEQDVPPDVRVQNICDGVQRDLRNDDDHCGSCNNACDDNFGGCVNGACLCPFTTEPCGGLNSCTDTEFDPNNCGGCGVQCSPGEFCVSSVCTCRPGYTLCNGECVDTDNDPRYCGSCATACNGDACKNGDCQNNSQCGFGRWRCELPNNVGVACIEGQSNHLYCNPGFGNPCGTVCAADEFCYDPGFGSPRECYKFRAAIRCQSCPCNECTDNESCNVSESIPGEIFCVAN